jgi:hypothetical protein
MAQKGRISGGMTYGHRRYISLFGNTFYTRTIYTRGYAMCGYQSSSPWRNTNRTIHSTDTTTNLGDMMDYGASYVDAGFSDYNAYLFNDSGAVQGNTSFTSSMSMVTESYRTHTSSWDMTVSRTNCKSLMNKGLTSIYITGGANSSTDKLSTVTDTMLGAGTIGANGATSGGTAGGLSGFFGEFYGIIGANSNSSSLSWTTETWTTGTWSWCSNTDGQPKGLSSKYGLGYNASGSYGGSSTLYKFNDTTGSLISSMSRPDTCGEENCQIGQDWGYTLGSYNGAQTNNSTKTSYTTDSCVALGSTGQPKGHGGMSSGGCGTAASLIAGANGPTAGLGG